MLLSANILGQPGAVRPSRDQRLFCFVIEQLAAAVGGGLPVVPALRALQSDPELTRTGLRRAAWRQRLGLLLGDIEAGRTLSEAFERHLGSYLPPHFVRALRCAEKADCVGRILPLLTANLCATVRSRYRWRGALVYPLVQFVVMASVIAGLFVFVVPKFLAILAELTPVQGVRCTELLRALAGIFAHSGTALLWALPVLLGLALLRRSLGRRASGRRLLEAVGERLPLARGLLRRRGLAETAGALAAFLAAGVDLSTAAQWAADSVETRWARGRLRRFAAALATGTPCADAWTALAVRSPLCDWMVHNAVARERPADGFQAVAEWALEDLSRCHRRLFMCLEPALILVNAFIVATLIFALIGSLFSTIYAVLEI